jgi:hypothetical protein
LHGGLLDGAQRPHRPGFFAQVGEWLKPTDCKSVPPSEVRRFESFPVHHIDSVSRLSIALICYVVLGALTWATITDPKLRAGTLVILALFAVKSVLRRRDLLHGDEDKVSEAEKAASVEVAES